MPYTPPNQERALDAMPVDLLEQLPGEIRNMIYSECLKGQDLIEIDTNGDRPLVKGQINALMRTCSRYHDEFQSFRKHSGHTARLRIDISAFATMTKHATDTKRLEADRERALVNIAMVPFGHGAQVCGYGIRDVEFHLVTVGIANNDSYPLVFHDSAIHVARKASDFIASRLRIPLAMVCDISLPNQESATIQLATRSGDSWEMCPNLKVSLPQIGRRVHLAWTAGEFTTHDYAARRDVLHSLRTTCLERLERKLVHTTRYGMSDLEIQHRTDAVKQRNGDTAAEITRAYDDIRRKRYEAAWRS